MVVQESHEGLCKLCFLMTCPTGARIGGAQKQFVLKLSFRYVSAPVIPAAPAIPAIPAAPCRSCGKVSLRAKKSSVSARAIAPVHFVAA